MVISSTVVFREDSLRVQKLVTEGEEIAAWRTSQSP